MYRVTAILRVHTSCSGSISSRYTRVFTRNYLDPAPMRGESKKSKDIDEGNIAGTRVGEILEVKGSTYETIDPNATVVEAARKMMDNNIGSLLVMDSASQEDGFPIGMITEREIVKKVVSAGLSPETTKVKDAMMTDVPIIFAEDLAVKAMAIMTHIRSRHLLVASSEKKTIGLVSIGDLVKSASKDYELEAEYLRNYITRGDLYSWQKFAPRTKQDNEHNM